MKLTNDDIDYQSLLKISQELALVVAYAVGDDRIMNKGLNEAECFISFQWSVYDRNKTYAESLRLLAAACLYVLLDIEEKEKRGGDKK